MPFEQQVADILKNAEAYHRDYYEAERFGGPSLYFHRRSLAARTAELTEQHLEYVYATLSSWGMHRMGKGGSKMHPFDVFRESIAPLRGRIAEAQSFALSAMNDHTWDSIREIFCGLKVMATETSLVGNSKAMHHMIPNIVPPIDREYTLNYLRGNKNIKNGLDTEWDLLKSIVTDFFAPVAADKSFAEKARLWTSQQAQYPWDTSPLKVVDNLVIGRQHATSR